MAIKFKKSKITTRAVDALKPGEAICDTNLPGYHVRRQQKGKIYFVRKYAHGQRHFVSIGEHGKAGITEKKARDLAAIILAAIQQGHDPSAERAKAKGMPSLDEFADTFFEGHGVKLKTSTLRDYKSNYKTHLRGTALGKMKLDKINRQHMAQKHRKLKDKPRTANKVLQIVSSMYGEAQRAGLVPDSFNPTRKIRQYKIDARQRFLSNDELSRLGEAMAQGEKDGTENKHALAAIGLLVMTGARRGEILSLRWEWVDFENGCLRLSDSKTGQKVIQLNADALELLTNLPRIKGNPFVIPGLKPGTHWVNLYKTWVRLCERAKLEPTTKADGTIQAVRIHDLRHTYASQVARGGASLPMIGALLGHTQMQTTQRYAHLCDDPLKKVNAKAGSSLARALKPASDEHRNTTEIVKLKELIN